MTTPTKIVVDCSTGAVEEVALTAEEIAQREVDLQAQAAADAEAKAALLTKLGITADEAKLLLA
jgi:hypothetical protein